MHYHCNQRLLFNKCLLIDLRAIFRLPLVCINWKYKIKNKLSYTRNDFGNSVDQLPYCNQLKPICLTRPSETDLIVSCEQQLNVSESVFTNYSNWIMQKSLQTIDLQLRLLKRSVGRFVLLLLKNVSEGDLHELGLV